MIRQFFKATLVVSMVASVLVGCNGSKPLGMGSEESISKIKELVKTNVDMNENKIYELQWEEDNGEHKLENTLSSITVSYIDKENNDYKLIIELKDGEFVAGEPDKNEKWKYSYEKSTALNLDDINAGLLKKMVKEGYDLFMTQEDSTQYDLKSVGKYRFYIYPVKVGREQFLAENESFKKEYTTMVSYFDLNFIKKDEAPEVRGKHIWTNYYTASFKIDENGEIGFF